VTPRGAPFFTYPNPLAQYLKYACGVLLALAYLLAIFPNRTIIKLVTAS
jgi:hypothetical protein